jgi:hypothetical protein
VLPVSGFGRSSARLRAFVMGAIVASVPPAATYAQIPGVQWTTTLEDRAVDYELKAATVGTDGRVVVVIDAEGTDGKSHHALLGTVDATGKASTREFLIPLDGGAGAQTGQFAAPAMAARKDALLFTLSNRAGDIALADVSPETGRIIAQRPANLPAGSRTMRMIRVGNGDVVLLGSAAERGFAARITAAGPVAWSRVLEEPALVLYDGAVTTDDGVIVVGAKATNPAKPDLRNTRLWVGKFSASGQLTASKLFDLQLGSVSQSIDGTILLVSSSMSGRTVTVTARGLAGDLSEKWTRDLTTSSGFVRFVSARAPGGGFIVAGERDNALWLSKLRDDGTAVWTEARKPGPPEFETVRNVDLLVDGDAAMAAYTAMVIRGRTQQRVVRVIRFNAKAD